MKTIFENKASLCGYAFFIIAFISACYMFIEIQVLKAYPFYTRDDAGNINGYPHGHFGPEQFFMGITYTEFLELSGLLSAIGLFIAIYFKRRSLKDTIGKMFVFYGFVITIIIFLEIHILYPLLHEINGGGGYPWGSERVACNTQFIGSVENCWFLNYYELLYFAVGVIIAGLIMVYQHKEVSIPAFSLSRAEIKFTYLYDKEVSIPAFSLSSAEINFPHLYDKYDTLIYSSLLK